MIERLILRSEPEGQKVEPSRNRSSHRTREHGQTFKIPPEIAPFLKERPVIREESDKDYDAILFEVAKTVAPSDFIEWMWVKDVADLVWETQRARRARRELLELAFVNSIIGDLEEAQRNLERLTQQAAQEKNIAILQGVKQQTSPENLEIFQNLLEKVLDAIWECKSGLPKSWRKRIPRLLVDCGIPFDERRVWAEAQLGVLDRLQPLDEYIAALDARRDALFREIERRRETIARRLRLMSDAIIQPLAGGRSSLTIVDSSTGSAEK